MIPTGPFRLDAKLERIREGGYRRGDFILADAKDGDMGPSIGGIGALRAADGTPGRLRTREQQLGFIREVIAQDVVDIMLTSASVLERLVEARAYEGTGVKPAIRANDATDIWGARGGRYTQSPSRPFRTASIRPERRHTDLGLYSITFNNDLDADLRSLEAYAAFREEAIDAGFHHFLEVFNPNVETGIPRALVPSYVNDCIARTLAGLTHIERPLFLKIAYNGPAALEELTRHDPSVVVGVLGGGAGTSRDAFELIHQAEKYGARVALFGRKINLAESPLAMVRMLRLVADGEVAPAEAVKAYHGELQKAGIRPDRAIEDDSAITEPPLKG